MLSLTYSSGMTVFIILSGWKEVALWEYFFQDAVWIFKLFDSKSWYLPLLKEREKYTLC